MGAARIQQVVRGFYKAGTMKFLLTCGLFAYVFMMLQPLNAAFIFVAYIVSFIVHQVAAFMIIGRH